jgi:hypothetical protein
MTTNRYNITAVASALDRLSSTSVFAETLVQELISASGDNSQLATTHAQIASLREVIESQKMIIISLRHELTSLESLEYEELSDDQITNFKKIIISSISSGGITQARMLYPLPVLLSYPRPLRAIIATELVNTCRNANLEPDPSWLNLMLTNGGSS